MTSVAGGMDPSGGSCKSGPDPKKRPTWTRRSWSVKEEECLLAALKEIVAQGWRSDNGFKAGYLHKLEAAMKAKFPDTDLKQNPHINSKITQWKKNYGTLQDIMSRSGAGFSSRGDFMLEVENDMWEQICKVDGNAKGMRYKPWPYYYDWCECFGKDRATGDLAEDMPDAANNLNNDINDVDMGSFRYENHESGDDVNDHEDQADSVSQAAKFNSGSKGKGKRRTLGDIEMVCDTLGEIGIKADVRLGEMVKRMGYDFDVKKTKKEAFRLLDFVPGLDIRQKFIVCQILAKELDKLDVFMGLPDEERPSYVLFLLEEAGKI